jgi:hypothetical protein
MSPESSAHPEDAGSRRRAVRLRRGYELRAEPLSEQEQMDYDLGRWFRENRREVNKRTQTAVVSMAYDVAEACGLMDLEPHCSADGRGVTEVFSKAVPGISHIQVFIAGKIDMDFKKSATGVWRGQMVKERAPQA